MNRAYPKDLFYFRLLFHGPVTNGNFQEAFTTPGTDLPEIIPEPPIRDTQATVNEKPTSPVVPGVDRLVYISCESYHYNNTVFDCRENLNYKNVKVEAAGDDGMTFDVSFDTPAILKFEPADYELDLATTPVTAYVVLINSIPDINDDLVADQVITMTSNQKRLLFDGKTVDRPTKSEPADPNVGGNDEEDDGKPLDRKWPYITAIAVGIPLLLGLIGLSYCTWMTYQSLDISDENEPIEVVPMGTDAPVTPMPANNATPPPTPIVPPTDESAWPRSDPMV